MFSLDRYYMREMKNVTPTGITIITGIMLLAD